MVFEERIKQQNAELAASYKERACIAEELVKSNRQLQVNSPPLSMACARLAPGLLCLCAAMAMVSETGPHVIDVCKQ